MRIWFAFCGVIGVVSTRTQVHYLALDVYPEDPAAQWSDRTCDDWTAWIPPRTEPSVVLQVVSAEFISMEKNFIRLMEANSRFRRENIYLLCLDEESQQEIAAMAFRCVPMMDKWKKSLIFLWKLRVNVLSCLLEAGYNVIISDGDALWLKDPVLDFDSPLARGSSIVASRGSSPRELRHIWGSTMCMGFIFFRAGACMQKVFDNMKQFVIKTRDDQKSVNYALNKLGVKWDGITDMRYYSGADFSTGFITDPSGCSLNVTLLPHNRYTRHCEAEPISPITAVAHCRAKKGNSSAKTKWMLKAKLWDVDEPVETEHGEGYIAKRSADHTTNTKESLDMSHYGT